MSESNKANQPLAGPGGVVLDQYELLEPVSASRTGLVYKARHRVMGRTVAIKFLSPEAAASATLTARFHRAIQLLARLEHANLLQIYEAGQQGDAHFMVMEYVEGQDLRTTVKEKGPLPWEQAVEYTIQAALGLGYVHQQGACHRNIKPGNLLVDRQGVLRVIGFTLAHVEAGGAASEAGVADDLTRQGQVMGTYDYMSPEQAVDSRNVDPRSDIYSLGCTLHALLTGRPPYAGKGMQQIMAHRGQPIPSLAAARPDVPAGLDRVFAKMIAKTPEERYASMEVVVAELSAVLMPATVEEVAAAPEQAVAEQPVAPVVPLETEQPRPISLRYARATDEATRSPGDFAGIIAIGVLAVVAMLLLGYWWAGRKPATIAKKGEEVAESRETVATQEREPTEMATPERQPTEAKRERMEMATPERKPVQEADQASPKAEKVEPVTKPVAPAETPSRKPAVGAAGPAVSAMAVKPAAKTNEPAAETPRPVPDTAARERAARLVRETYQDELTKARNAADKSALAKKFLSKAKDLEDDPAGRFALLEASNDLAREAVDAATAVQVVETAARHYTVDRWSMQTNLLTELAAGAKNSAHYRGIAQQAIGLAQQAIDEGEFDVAGKLTAVALAQAARLHDPQAIARIRSSVKDLDGVLAQYRRYEAAKATLVKEPKNRDASLEAGRFECLVADHWNEGLGKLAAGSDETLRRQAAKDLAAPTDADGQAAVADGWWELAKAESGRTQAALYSRAKVWYEKALATATGLLKGKIEKRLETIRAAEKDAKR